VEEAKGVKSDQVLLTQSKARVIVHGGVNGGMSQGGDGLNTNMGMSDADKAEQRYIPRVWDAFPPSPYRFNSLQFPSSDFWTQAAGWTWLQAQAP